MKTIRHPLIRFLGTLLIIAAIILQPAVVNATSALFDLTLALDGVDDYASAPDSSSLDLGDSDGEDFTIETFFYVPDLTNTTTDTLFWKQGAYGLYILYSNTIEDRFIFRLYTSALSTDYVFIYYNVNLSIGWHHVAAVFDNEYTPSTDLAALYLDGNQVVTGTGVDWTPGIWNSSSALNIGGYVGVNPTAGWLDEARISDIVRYVGPTYTVPSSAFVNDVNTRALWHFDDSWGSTSFIDSSTNGNDLTGINGAHIGNPTNTPPNTSATFGDVPSTYWAWDYIERLYSAGITGGCSMTPLNYCPNSQVTRAQMAVFLEKGINGSSYSPPNVAPTFNDTIGHWAEDWIEALKNDGVTGGCGGGNFCPNNPVTRAQMAVFLLKSEYGSSYTPPAVGASTGFTDVPTTHWAAPWIKQLAAEGITGGCGGGNYCPNNSVTRAQMAVFLVKTFNLP